MGVPVGAGSVTFCGLDAGHTAGSRSRASGAVESTPAGGRWSLHPRAASPLHIGAGEVAGDSSSAPSLRQGRRDRRP